MRDPTPDESDALSSPSVMSELMHTSVVTVREGDESAVLCGEARLEMVWLALTVTVPLLPAREVGVTDLTRRSCIEECTEEGVVIPPRSDPSPRVQVEVKMLRELG